MDAWILNLHAYPGGVGCLDSRGLPLPGVEHHHAVRCTQNRPNQRVGVNHTGTGYQAETTGSEER